MARGGKIYLITEEKGPLAEMNESVYDSEEILQELLASYPDLLAGEQISPDSPLKWLLIKREIGIPGEKTEGDRWSLDHLFVDQDGIPTFVECKRSSDTRIRREVVGQMLDYAANAIKYWPIEKLRESAAETAEKSGNHDLTELIISLLEPSEPNEEVVEGFWESVETNLREGRVRLLFVSDRIPVELRRVVEFLNEQMSLAEVFAIEVKQYAGEGKTALVPRVLGTITKPKGPTHRATPWTESEFLENFRSRDLEEVRVRGIESLLQEAKRLEDAGSISISWGKGRETGSFTIKRNDNSFLSIFSNSYIWLNMGGWNAMSAENKSRLAKELGNKLAFPLEYTEHSYPNIAGKVFSSDDGAKKLVEWLHYAIEVTDQAPEE